jgi:ribosome-interacting GTPase 1
MLSEAHPELRISRRSTNGIQRTEAEKLIRCRQTIQSIAPDHKLYKAKLTVQIKKAILLSNREIYLATGAAHRNE